MPVTQNRIETTAKRLLRRMPHECRIEVPGSGSWDYDQYEQPVPGTGPDPEQVYPEDSSEDWGECYVALDPASLDVEADHNEELDADAGIRIPRLRTGIQLSEQKARCIFRGDVSGGAERAGLVTEVFQGRVLTRVMIILEDLE